MSYGDRSKVKHSVQDVLKDIEDWRTVSWLVDDMINHKPSDLADILQAREAKLTKKHGFAQKNKGYNQPNVAPQKPKKKSYHQER